jgi:hypothetical protein
MGLPLRASGDREREAALDRARRTGRLLDEAFALPVVNYRIGLDSIIGLIPVVGDALAAAMALYLVFEGFRAGAPLWLVFVMLLLVAIDFLVGSIPLAGDIFDALWKANAWNVTLLERHVADDESAP